MEPETKISARVSEKFRTKVKLFATSNGVPLESVIIQALIEYMQREAG